MNVLFILVPVSLFLAGLALAFFLWTLRSDQYDDLEGDAWRILSDDDSAPRSEDDDVAED